MDEETKNKGRDPETAWVQAQDALQSALLLAARMKDGHSQLLILRLFIVCVLFFFFK